MKMSERCEPCPYGMINIAQHKNASKEASPSSSCKLMWKAYSSFKMQQNNHLSLRFSAMANTYIMELASIISHNFGHGV